MTSWPPSLYFLSHFLSFILFFWGFICCSPKHFTWRESMPTTTRAVSMAEWQHQPHLFICIKGLIVTMGFCYKCSGVGPFKPKGTSFSFIIATLVWEKLKWEKRKWYYQLTWKSFHTVSKHLDILNTSLGTKVRIYLKFHESASFPFNSEIVKVNKLKDTALILASVA